MERDNIRVEIYGKEIEHSVIKQVLADIKQKKELKFFSDEALLKYATYILKRQRPVRELLLEEQELSDLRKKRLYQSLLKQVRDVARRTYGVYITKEYSKREDFFEEKDWDGLLDLHLSTKERKSYYREILTELVKRTVKPKSILDLACGFNPIGVLQCAGNKIEYIASDISPLDTDFVQKCLDAHPKANSDSQCFPLDLTESKNWDDLSEYKTDWCLLFKALDPLEEITEGTSMEMLPHIKSKWIIVSFPTMTISRKPMRNPKRSWFEKVLNRLEKEYEIYESFEEIFYIIKNH